MSPSVLSAFSVIAVRADSSCVVLGFQADWCVVLIGCLSCVASRRKCSWAVGLGACFTCVALRRKRAARDWWTCGNDLVVGCFAPHVRWDQRTSCGSLACQSMPPHMNVACPRCTRHISPLGITPSGKPFAVVVQASFHVKYCSLVFAHVSCVSPPRKWSLCSVA